MTNKRDGNCCMNDEPADRQTSISARRHQRVRFFDCAGTGIDCVSCRAWPDECSRNLDEAASGRRTLCWSGIKSSSIRSSQRIRPTRQVSGSEPSCIRRSSTPTTALSSATRRSSCTTSAPRGASRRAAIIAAGVYGARRPFSVTKTELDALYAASVAALSAMARTIDRSRRSCTSFERGIDWGTAVAHSVLAWRATDGFSATLSGVHRRDCCRPVAADAPGIGPMSAQGLAFTDMFVLISNTQFRPDRRAV